MKRIIYFVIRAILLAAVGGGGVYVYNEAQAQEPKPLYFHSSHALGSVLRNQHEDDGNLPYWGSVGFTYQTNPDFDLFLELYHRSNADRQADGEYNHEGLRIGFTYKHCLAGC